jgi:hypothetical protein
MHVDAPNDSDALCVELDVPAARAPVSSQRNLLLGLELYAAEKALTLGMSMRPDTLRGSVSPNIGNVPLFHFFLAFRTTKTGLGHWFPPERATFAVLAGRVSSAIIIRNTTIT